MDKDFTLYEEAFELKQLGFDEPCNTCYDKLEMVASYGASVFDYKNYNTSGYMVSRPTFSQAFRWFRENYNIDISINTVYSKYNENTSKKYGGVIDNESVFTNVGFHDTYEEAEFACLKKLIKILKNK
jgi:hypothetical protein